MSRIQLNINVLEAAKQRFKYLFENFNIVVSISGGKDSSVILQLAIDEARRQGKLPVKAIFIDQEAELQSAIDVIRDIHYNNDDVELFWYQIPFKINISTNSTEHHLLVWDDDAKDKWIREKEPDTIHSVDFIPIDTYFNKIFDKILYNHFAGYANIGGVRAAESPKRLMSLQSGNIFNGITWGKTIKNAFIFYPIYDWRIEDVWKYIYDKDIKYCKIYDYQHQLGVPLNQMRVSSIFHENSLGILSYLPEAEPKTWNKVCNRINGANTLNKGSLQLYSPPNKLPIMFNTWEEYVIHLLITLIEEEYRGRYIKKIVSLWGKAENVPDEYREDWVTSLNKAIVSTILKNDFVFTILDNQQITAWQKIYRNQLKK